MAKAVSVLRAPDRLARACMAVGCLLVAFAAVCTAQAPTLTTPGAWPGKQPQKAVRAVVGHAAPAWRRTAADGC
jgi:hypothetical protein